MKIRHLIKMHLTHNNKNNIIDLIVRNNMINFKISDSDSELDKRYDKIE